MPGVDLISLSVEMSRRDLGEVKRETETETEMGRWRDREIESKWIKVGWRPVPRFKDACGQRLTPEAGNHGTLYF